ncbi:MAG: hypothetical protein ACLU37_12455 [Collinsella sp.]
MLRLDGLAFRPRGRRRACRALPCRGRPGIGRKFSLYRESSRKDIEKIKLV